MMRHTVVLISLISSALAQISATCENIAFNDDTDVLSADCVPRNQQGRVSTELDLNACFGYDGTNLTATYNGNFRTSCDGCRIFIAPDPWYGFQSYWLGCSCSGQSAEASVSIEVAVAHQYVTNDDGHLTC